MPGCLDIALDATNANFATEVSGDVWVDDLASGSREIYIDHSGTADFTLAGLPVISITQGDADGLSVGVLLSATVSSVLRQTDGKGFILQLTVTSTGEDQSRGGASADWHLYWTRRGVL